LGIAKVLLARSIITIDEPRRKLAGLDSQK
jgi:hypothetical protein